MKMLRKVLCMVAITASANTQLCAQTNTKEQVNSDGTFIESVTFHKDTLILKNWFVHVGGGGQIYYGDHDRQCDTKDRIAPELEVGVGKWLSPVIGVRLMYQGLSQRGATKLPGQWDPRLNRIFDVAYPVDRDNPINIAHPQHMLQAQKFKFGNLSLTAMFNLCNVFKPYRKEKPYGFIPYLGVGFAFNYGHPEPGKKSPREVTYNAGILQTARINRYFDAYMDLRSMYVNDRFDGEGGGRFGEGNWSLSAGIVYKFEKRGFNESKTIVKDYWDYSQATVDRNGRLTINGQPVNTVKIDANRIQDLQKNLENTMKENSRLIRLLGEGNREKEIVDRLVAAPNLVVFPINKSKLSNEARVHLKFMAETIKMCDPNIVYVISGYADKGTGTKKINEKLSQDRAKAVYDCLINEFGISPKQLRMESHGGVDNMFYDDPRLSRAAITVADIDYNRK